MARIKFERFSEELEEMAYEMAVNGERFQHIAEKMGLKNAGQLKTYRNRFEEFDHKLTEAVITYCEHLEEELLEIPHKHDKEIAKLLSNNIIKVLEFRNPKRYSPRQQHDINVTIDIAGALERAKNRVIDITSNVVHLNKGKKES